MSSFLSQGEGGDYRPWVRWGAKTCKWEMGVEGGGSVPLNFTQAIFDMENLRVGWASIQAGQAPQWVFAKSLSENLPKPEGVDKDGKPLFKKGFSVQVFSKALFGKDAVRDFATNQKASLEAIKVLIGEYEAQKAANPGAVPVVEFSGHSYVGMGANGTNVPMLKIVKFVPRPAELASTQAATNAVPAPAAQQNNVAAPVAAVASGSSEF